MAQFRAAQSGHGRHAINPIKTDKANCRKCYACVRNCPVKAIRVCRDHAEVIPERCIGCGKCVRVCSQNAKTIANCMEDCERLLQGPHPPIAVLGCSYPAFFNDISPGQLVTGLKRLGFGEIHEGAAGVDLLTSAYHQAMADSTRRPLITSHCPTIVDLIERHYPQLLKNLAELVSPMVAIGRFIKERAGPDSYVVYISSCIAGKFEIASEQTSGAIDCVITYNELAQMLDKHGLNLKRLGESALSGRSPDRGRLFSISGGPFQALEIQHDILSPDFVTAEGAQNSLEVIKDLAAGRITPHIVDIRFCNGGCIGGPGKSNRLTTFSKRKLIIDYHNNHDFYYHTQDRYQTDSPMPDVGRTFSSKAKQPDIPSGERLRQILQATNKFDPNDELDCGACGHGTCREQAVAIYQGLAESDMCLPYSLKRLEQDRVTLTQKYELAQRALAEQFGSTDIVGKDRRTLGVLELIRQVGPTLTTVLLRGESGTGKELTARAIHEKSRRADKTLVTVNCTTLTDSLLESELFGHVKGSFSGAVNDKCGLFEAANGGSIFLDEIGDITPKLQAELLRVLDSGEIRRVGGNASLKVDVRLIAATNKNLEEGVEQGWFRKDLFYRLNVFTITMPPLRDRLESLDELVQIFLSKASQRVNKTLLGIEDRALRAMHCYHWPGNIRELQNIIERAAVLTHDKIIRLENLPVIFSEFTPGRTDSDDRAGYRTTRQKQVGQLEKKLITAYLLENRGNVTASARQAGIPRRTFYRLLERYNLRGCDFKR